MFKLCRKLGFRLAVFLPPTFRVDLCCGAVKEHDDGVFGGDLFNNNSSFILINVNAKKAFDCMVEGHHCTVHLHQKEEDEETLKGSFKYIQTLFSLDYRACIRILFYIVNH